MGLPLTTILGSADPRLCTQPQAPCRNVNLASARVALPGFCGLGEQRELRGPLCLNAGESFLLPASSDNSGSFPTPLGSESCSETLSL